MELDVIKYKNKEGYKILKESLNNNCTYFLNGIETKLINNLIIPEDAIITVRRNGKILKEYKRGNEVLSIKEYQAKPQSYNSYSSEEHTLRALANRKELEGFEAIYEENPIEDVEIKIVGYVEYTGSNFINSQITSGYRMPSINYILYVNLITMDEYNNLKEEYNNQGKFETPDRRYLRFVKVNNKYAFGDGYPFGDSDYIRKYDTLEEAQAEEQKVRNMVRTAVINSIFPQNIISTVKAEEILAQLKIINKLKTKLEMTNALNLVIKDLTNYTLKRS